MKLDIWYKKNTFLYFMNWVKIQQKKNREKTQILTIFKRIKNIFLT